jgi:hypothetical protein
MAKLRETEVGILKHSLGLNRSDTAYRNYFCADEGHADMPTISSLLQLGFMRASHKINDGRDTIYVVTEAGKQALHNNRSRK